MNFSTSPKSLFNLSDISSNYVDQLSISSTEVTSLLEHWVTSDNFLTAATVAFGSASDSDSWANTLLDLKQSILNGDFSIRLELRSNVELQSALGAYSAIGTTAEPTIYLNADWFATASAEAVQAVLLEELGHAFDDYLHAGVDSQGDEGAIFSALVRGVELSTQELAQLRTEDDTNTIVLDGQSVAVEQAIDFSPTAAQWVDLPRTGDPNKQDSDGVWTANASDLVGDSTTPYLQIQADGTNIAFKVLVDRFSWR